MAPVSIFFQKRKDSSLFIKYFRRPKKHSEHEQSGGLKQATVFYLPDIAVQLSVSDIGTEYFKETAIGCHFLSKFIIRNKMPC